MSERRDLHIERDDGAHVVIPEGLFKELGSIITYGVLITVAANANGLPARALLDSSDDPRDVYTAIGHLLSAGYLRISYEPEATYFAQGFEVIA